MFSCPLQESRVNGDPASLDRYQLKHFKYSSHYWILQFISQAQRPLRILDVGTADGYLGAILKQQGHFVVGVERDAMLAEKARRYYDAFHLADLEAFDFPYENEFDFILLADVLEHLRDPAAILSRILPALKKSGQVILSVPNIANFIVRGLLLFGHFEYTERGILDQSHLRFFTLATINKLICENGYRIVDVVPTPVPVQLVAPKSDKRIFAPLHELHYAIVRARKTLFAYQFVISCAHRANL